MIEVVLVLTCLGAGYALQIALERYRLGRATTLAREVRQRAAVQVQQLGQQAAERVKQFSEREQRALAELAGEQERLLSASEAHLERRERQLDRWQVQLDKLEATVRQQEAEIAALQQRIEQAKQEAGSRLTSSAGLSDSAGKALLLAQLDRELEHEETVRLRAWEEKARRTASRKAESIVAQAIFGLDSEHNAASRGATPVPWGRREQGVLARERDLASFQRVVGLELLVQGTPEASVMANYNPNNREGTLTNLHRLAEQGIIDPQRVEAVMEEAARDFRAIIYERGEAAALEANIGRLTPEMARLVGTMFFRTSYSQNILNHSVEVARLAGIIAAELKLKAETARRCGIMHDVGKAIDQGMQGTHVEVGEALARRFGEPEEVMDTIVHHHELEKSATLFPWIVEAADAISAARPGARRETSDLYMERLRALEAAAASFPAVQEVHAIDGGRNLQVFVNPSRADDTACAELARQIAQKVEAEVHYPGQVQVTVVRSLIATAQAAQWGATGEEPPNKGRNGNGRLLYPRRSLAELALGPEVVVQLVKGAEATPAAK